MSSATNSKTVPVETQFFSPQLFYGSMILFMVYFLVAIQTTFYIAAALVIALPLLITFAYYLFKIPGLTIGLMIAATSLDVVGRLTGEGAAIPVTIFHLMFFISIVMLVLKKLWGNRLLLFKTGIDFPLFLYLIFIGITIFWSRERLDAITSLGRLFALIIAMYITLNLVDSKAGVRLVIILIFLPALGLSIYASQDFLTASSVEVKNALSMLKLFSRFGATFDNPNYFATFLLLPLCISFSVLAFLEMPLWKKIVFFLIPMMIFGVAFVGTFSRSAWVAIFTSYLFIFSYFKNKKYWIAGFLLSAGLLAVILFQTAFFQSFILRFASIFEGKADPSSATRIFLINGAWQMFVDSHFVGVGFESFPSEYIRYMPPNQMLGYVHECHSLPMEVLAELGLIGITLFFIVFLRAFKIGRDSIKQASDNFCRTIQIGFVAFYIGLMINFLFMPGGILNNLLWISLGLIFALKRLNEASAVNLQN